MIKLIHWLGLLITLWSPWLAADSIEIIDLKNRPAEEIVPILKPMLHPDDAISGSGFQVILRTSPANLQQIKQLVSHLDKEAGQLMISVFQGEQRDLDKVSSQIASRYRDNDTSISVGRRAPHGSATATTGNDNLSVSGSVRNTRIQSDDYPVHQLRIMEGSSGYIETGHEIPYFSGSVYRSRGHDIVEGGIDYLDVTTGFYVLPRLYKQRVTLEISPFKASPSRAGGGIIDTQSASTKISGPVGQWMEIGGVETEYLSSGNSIGKQYRTRDWQSNRLWIRADLLD